MEVLMTAKKKAPTMSLVTAPKTVMIAPEDQVVVANQARPAESGCYAYPPITPDALPVLWITVSFDNGKHYRVAAKNVARAMAAEYKISYEAAIRSADALIAFATHKLRWLDISQYAFQYVAPQPFIEADHWKDAKKGIIRALPKKDEPKPTREPIVQQALNAAGSEGAEKKVRPPITAYEKPFPDFEGDGDDGEVMDL
jgi:hypothetical protein